MLCFWLIFFESRDLWKTHQKCSKIVSIFGSYYRHLFYFRDNTENPIWNFVVLLIATLFNRSPCKLQWDRKKRYQLVIKHLHKCSNTISVLVQRYKEWKSRCLFCFCCVCGLPFFSSPWWWSPPISIAYSVEAAWRMGGFADGDNSELCPGTLCWNCYLLIARMTMLQGDNMRAHLGD